MALEADFPVCGPNGNGVVAVHGRAPLWGDSVPRLRPGRVAMVSQSGNVAVNALGSRRGIDFHTVVSTGNQAVLDASDWLAALAEADGVGSVAMFLEADGDGAKLASALAAVRRARDRRRRAQGRRLGGGLARRGRSHRRARRRPAGVPGAGRGGGRRLGRRSARAARARPGAGRAAGAAARQRRPRGAHLLGRRLGARGGRGGADRTGSAPVRARDPRAAHGAAARRRNRRQPARLHVADLDRDRPPAPDRRDGWPRPRRSTSCCSATTTRTGSPPSTRPSWAGVRTALAEGALESGAASMFAATLPDLIDPEADPRARRPRPANGRRTDDLARLRAWRCAGPRAIPPG